MAEAANGANAGDDDDGGGRGEQAAGNAHLRCLYCLALYPLAQPAHGAPPLHCAAPLPRDQCYTCGASATAAAFSARQRERLASGSEPARCAACTAAGAVARHEPPQPPASLGEQLEEAVGAPDEARVAALLAQGADANHVRQRGVSLGGRWRGLFAPSGAPLPELDPDDVQPTTPLKLVGFRASDCMLGQGELASLARVAGLLLQHGARAAPALRHMERRYGPFDAAAGALAGGDGLGAVFALVHAAAAAQAGGAAAGGGEGAAAAAQE